MALSDLELVRDPSGLPPGYVWLRFTDGNLTRLVSITRPDVDGIAQQRLSPAEQDALVEKNLDTLAQVIETKRGPGWSLKQAADPSTAPVMTILLTRMDLEQAIRLAPVSSTASMPVEWPPEHGGYIPVRRLDPSPDPVGQPSTPLPLRANPQQPPEPQQPIMSPGVIGARTAPSVRPASEGLPVQSYLVTTPLSFEDATLVSLTLRFDERLHNALPDPSRLLETILQEAIVEGWQRVPLGSGDALLDRLASLGPAISQPLRDAIVEALDQRAAVLRFSSPSPFRFPDLQRLRTGVVGFSKVSPKQVFVGIVMAGACIIGINIEWGVGAGLRTTTEYAVTEIGRALVDKVAQQLRITRRKARPRQVDRTGAVTAALAAPQPLACPPAHPDTPPAAAGRPRSTSGS